MTQVKEARQFLISGQVQGVGYRYWTEGTAKELGLSGWVRNLFDGRVEIHAEGDSASLKQFETACHTGPSSADVIDVITRPCPDWNLFDFEQVASAKPPG